MTRISDVSLGLPEDIDADPDAIESGAEELDRVHRTMLGQSEDTYGQYRAAAQEFSDLLAWDITSHASVEVSTWQEASETLTFGAAVMRQWGLDIEDYRAARAELIEHWDTAKASMRSMLSSVDVTPALPPPPIPIAGHRALTTPPWNGWSLPACSMPDNSPCTVRSPPAWSPRGPMRFPRTCPRPWSIRGGPP